MRRTTPPDDKDTHLYRCTTSRKSLTVEKLSSPFFETRLTCTIVTQRNGRVFSLKRSEIERGHDKETERETGPKTGPHATRLEVRGPRPEANANANTNRPSTYPGWAPSPTHPLTLPATERRLTPDSRPDNQGDPKHSIRLNLSRAANLAHMVTSRCDGKRRVSQSERQTAVHGRVPDRGVGRGGEESPQDPPQEKIQKLN